MIELIQIKERGPTPRGMQRTWNASSKVAFLEAAEFFDDHLRDRRFTHTHARAAGYKRRKGELQPEGSKSFRRSYTGRKKRQFGHTRPLEFSGKTRDRLRSGGRRTSTSKGARISYHQASVFNFRHPKSQIDMAAEFRTILPEENQQLALAYDRRLDRELDDANFKPAG